MLRQIILDTETTGLEPSQGHRIIEIGCVEMINRRLTNQRFHAYLQPDREIDAGAVEIHGITNEFLADKPRFADVVEDLLGFIKGAELIIHNAPFDVGFVNHELRLLGGGYPELANYCSVLDTLALARRLHPGQSNSLDALCKRYNVDNSHRDLHGALLDAEILAEVYLAMTGGQATLSLEGAQQAGSQAHPVLRRVDSNRRPIRVISPGSAEQEAHQRRMAAIDKESRGKCLWLKLDS
jgi:DNA polymerase-3 subunit epsilon